MEMIQQIPYATPILVWLFAYLIGSISFGYLLIRATGHGDIRTLGSKGTGATNALRIAGKGIAAAVLLGDLLKGLLPVYAAGLYWDKEFALLVASGIFLGHLFPCWLGFRGGKAIASLIGMSIVLDWRMAAIFCICWLIIAGLTRYSSLASLLAAVTLPVSAALLHVELLLAGIIALLLVCFAHRNNILRLLHGKEPRIGERLETT